MKILVIGDTSELLSLKTQKKYGSGCLLNDSNYQDCFDSEGVWYTALGDLEFDQIKLAALRCDHVEFMQGLEWHDMLALNATLVLCNHINHFNTVHGLDPHRPQLHLTQPIHLVRRI